MKRLTRSRGNDEGEGRADRGTHQAIGTHRRDRRHLGARHDRLYVKGLGQLMTGLDPATLQQVQSPQHQRAGATRPLVSALERRGDGLAHIHHNRLDFHILIHPLLATFTAKTTLLEAAEGDFMGIAGGIVDAHEAII